MRHFSLPTMDSCQTNLVTRYIQIKVHVSMNKSYKTCENKSFQRKHTIAIQDIKTM